jgi:putative tryptophan/tyrosine transport system substrate-binding protein
MHHRTNKTHRSTRREFLLLSGTALAMARPAFADPQKPKIGYLSWFPDSMKDDLERFREGMERVGYARQDYVLEGYFTGGNPQLTRDVARKLVEEPVDVFVVVATPAIHIVKAATQTIPIVMYTANALATGLVPSLSHPGGNLTGVSLLLTDMAGKRLELLRQIDPGLHTAAFLGSTKDPNTVNFVNETQRAAEALGIKLVVKLVDGPQALNSSIFEAMKAEGSQAIIAQPIFVGYQKEIVAMAMKDRLPVISDWAAFAKAGALFTYGARQEAGMRRTAYYVDRILKGSKPADLPIEQPTEFELIVNAKTAKLLGLNVPQSLLTLADDIIE